jgi:hypothetical protein
MDTERSCSVASRGLAVANGLGPEWSTTLQHRERGWGRIENPKFRSKVESPLGSNRIAPEAGCAEQSARCNNPVALYPSPCWAVNLFSAMTKLQLYLDI